MLSDALTLKLTSKALRPEDEKNPGRSILPHEQWLKWETVIIIIIFENLLLFLKV